MIFFQFPWFSLDFITFLLISIGFIDFYWFCIDFLLISIDFYCFLLVFVEFLIGFKWFPDSRARIAALHGWSHIEIQKCQPDEETHRQNCFFFFDLRDESGSIHPSHRKKHVSPTWKNGFSGPPRSSLADPGGLRSGPPFIFAYFHPFYWFLLFTLNSLDFS